MPGEQGPGPSKNNDRYFPVCLSDSENVPNGAFLINIVCRHETELSYCKFLRYNSLIKLTNCWE